MVVSAFSRVETVLLSNENLGIGETEVFDPENGAFCDHDFWGKQHTVVEGGLESALRS